MAIRSFETSCLQHDTGRNNGRHHEYTAAVQVVFAKEVYSTCGDHVLCSCVDQDVSALAPCSHEKADTRILLHAMDAVEKDYRQNMLRTVDTDVVVLAVSTVVLLENTDTSQLIRSTHLWVQRRHMLFLCFTPSPVVTRSHRLLGKAKKTALNSWKSFNAVTEVFARLVT
ncbi:hypothetical protein Pcinc_007733 [Petrolisthes cinctipes]|uniref:Uncharacterized protein n=1 Tax=Petrolisthes cinctipes TaxID=88211 RepID=A0AAE1KY95_PETCI|nr:hypothetical protein Pcinc_007733 [Petrolisthes cinctipes]